MTEEEGEKKRFDVRAVNVGIGHKNDLAVTELGNIKFLTDTASERLNDRDQ